jgi:RimJ/RimL family protein N-acetyltransferase
MEIGLVTDEGTKYELARFISRHLGQEMDLDPFRSHVIMGVRDNRMVFVASYFNFRKDPDGTPRDLEFALAIFEPKLVTRDAIREAVEYPFVKLQYPRMTCKIADTNTRSIRLARRHGWVEEGVSRLAGIGGSTLITFGLMADECGYLKEGWHG